MTRPELTAELHEAAVDLYGADPDLDQIITALLNLHHKHNDNVQLSTLLTRIAGENGLIAVLALVLEGLADAKPVNDLPDPARNTAKAAIHSLAADLSHITTRGAAFAAAYELDPA